MASVWSLYSIEVSETVNFVCRTVNLAFPVGAKLYCEGVELSFATHLAFNFIFC